MDPRTQARTKADNLKKWFEGRELPKGRHPLTQGQTIIDAEGFVKAQITLMDAAVPLTPVFKNCFNRLFYFKQYLEKLPNETN